MRFKLKTLLTTSLLSISAVYGASRPSSPIKEGQEFKHDFTVGLESLSYKYEESTTEYKNLMNLKGLMYGVTGAYQFTWKDTLFMRPEARWTYGHTDYESWEGENSKMNHIPSLIFETRLLGGVPFKASSQLTISPYTGVGYRYKWDDSSDTKAKDGIAGYKRVNKLWYVPLGARLNYEIDQKWSVQGMIEYDWMIRGRQYSYNKKYIPSPLVNKQMHGFGVRGELLINRKFEKVSLAVGPYVNHWRIKKSKEFLSSLEYELGKIIHDRRPYEPQNTTTEIGFKLNITF